ncbi:MAG: carboxypeptidase regulatory-like domain-containing protein [Acidobacteriota bacterium]|nr:carboxypeptidase regulatory-like domain-containing protein [Acidobacteriota bacterium]MDE3169004.1 carboxypeptidase regulatory-like domain-containing protein [Acidobacteriota bacterium]
MNRTKWNALVVLAASVAALSVGAAAARIAGSGAAAARRAAQSSAAITGKVSFTGTPPKRAPLDMSADSVCAGEHSEPVLAPDGAVNSNGTLPDVFVYVEKVSGKFRVPPAATLDQTGCMYEPHVLGVMVGQELDIASSDPTTHNVHFMSKINKAWNETQEPGAPPLIHKFTRPEIMIMVHCNHHPWMSAYLGVTSNPFFAVTGDQGTFTIKGLPPGDYTLHAWTKAFGTQEQKITVRAGETTTANFTFK